MSINPSTLPGVLEITTSDFELQVFTGVIIQGRDGRDGSGGDAFFEYTQVLPSSSWVITHTLNKYPSVTVVDSSGTVVIGSVSFQSSSQITIDFGGGFSGKAYLN